MPGAGASLELSTSTGVVALLDTDGGRDERSECSDRFDSEEETDGIFFTASAFCREIESVSGGGGRGDGGFGVLSCGSAYMHGKR